MKLLVTENVQDFESLGWAERSISQLHNQFTTAVKKRCKNGCSDIFATPEASGNDKIDYYTNQYTNASRYSDLSKSERNKLDDQIEDAVSEVEKLRQQLKASDRDNDKNVATVLDLVLKIPGADHIWRVDGKPVVTMWGYSDDGSVLDLRSIKASGEKPVPIPTPRKKWPLLLGALAALLLIGFFAWPPVSCSMGWRSCHSPIANADDGVLQIGVSYVDLDIVQNDVEPDGDLITIASCDAPGQVLDGRRIRYTRDASLVDEKVAFSCTISDPEGNTDSALVTIQIPAPVNLPPQAHPDQIPLPLGATMVSHTILGNDSDEDMPSVSIKSCTTPSVGKATIVGKELHFTYTRDNRTNALSVSFSCTIEDSEGLTDSAVVTVDIPPVKNGLPSGGPINVTLEAEDLFVDIDILSKVTDPDGDAVHVIGCSAPGIQYGTGARYERKSTSSGVESFTCEVEDVRGSIGTVVVNVTVVPPVVNGAPFGGPINKTLEVGDSFVDIDILSEVTDPDGDSVRVIGCNAPGIQYGSGARYERVSTSLGIESFSCQVQDTEGSIGTIAVNVTIAEEIGICTPISKELPVQIFIGLDTSGSMNNYNRLSSSLTAIRRIVDEAPAVVTVTLVPIMNSLTEFEATTSTGRDNITAYLDKSLLANRRNPENYFGLYADWISKKLRSTDGDFFHTIVVTITDAPNSFPDQSHDLLQVFRDYEKSIEHIVILVNEGADPKIIDTFRDTSWPHNKSNFHLIDSSKVTDLTSIILQGARIIKPSGCD